MAALQAVYMQVGLGETFLRAMRRLTHRIAYS